MLVRVQLVAWGLFMSMSSASNTATPQFWEIIDRLEAAAFDEGSVSKIFSSGITGRKDNGFWLFSEGVGGTLSDGVVVEKFGLMQRHGDVEPSKVYIDVSGKCIAYSELEKRFPDLRIFSIPTDAGQGTGYKVIRQKGVLTFSVGPDPKGCVRNVGYSRQ